MFKIGQVSSKQLIKGLIASSAIILLVLDLVEAGGNKGDKGGNDIILYKNNLVIRSNGGGKGKGKGKGEGGSLIIAGGHDHHQHHEGHHFGHEMHHDFGDYHHGHKEQNFIMEAIRESVNKGNKGKGNKGKNNNQQGGMNMKSDGDGMNWEQLILGGKSGGGGGGYGGGF